MAKVLVTGASGFIGSRIVRQLVERGDDVKVLLRPSSTRKPLKGLPVEISEGDVMVGHTVYRALAGCDRLLHVAAVYKMWDRDPAKIMDPSIKGTQAVLDAVQARGSQIKKIVVTSSVAAVGVSAGEVMDENYTWNLADSELYLVAKRRAEEVALSRANELPITVVCPAGVFGPGDSKPTPSGQMILRYLNWNYPFGFPASDSGLSVVDVDDVAKGHLLALDKGKVGERYILGGENLTLTQVIEMLSGITGLGGPGGVPPRGLAALGGSLMELGARLFGGEPEITSKLVRDFYDGKLWVSSEKAKTELGYTFRGARKTLARSVRWYLDNGYLSPRVAQMMRYDELPAPDPMVTLPHERNQVFKEG